MTFGELLGYFWDIFRILLGNCLVAFGNFWDAFGLLLDTIWEMSLTAFDIPREVQVVVDGKMNLHISAGDPGFVWFKEPPMGMTLPIKCWIHTHPFGRAYFSGTDWNTVNIWQKNNAIYASCDILIFR